MEINEFETDFKFLCAVFRQKNISEEMKSYYLILKDMPLPKFKQSIDICAKGEWFPKVRDILMATYPEVSEISIKSDILRQISIIGFYGTPKFKYELSAIIVASIGWGPLCMTNENQISDKIHFEYKHASQAHKRAFQNNEYLQIEGTEEYIDQNTITSGCPPLHIDSNV